MKKHAVVIIVLSIISIASIVTNLYLNGRLNNCEEIDMNEIEKLISQDYIDDIKMLSSQLVNTKNHYDTLNNNFDKVNNVYLLEAVPPGQYGDIELRKIVLEFDSLGYVERIITANDSINRE